MLREPYAGWGTVREGACMRSGGGVSLGKIFGIPILLDYSFFLALAFVTYLLGASMLPDRVSPPPDAVVSISMAGNAFRRRSSRA